MTKDKGIHVSETYPQPYNYSEDIVPTRQPNHSIKTRKGRKLQKKANQSYAVKPTFDIPFGSNNTSAKSTSPAVSF
jgi:hypothetical protein